MAGTTRFILTLCIFVFLIGVILLAAGAMEDDPKMQVRLLIAIIGSLAVPFCLYVDSHDKLRNSVWELHGTVKYLEGKLDEIGDELHMVKNGDEEKGADEEEVV